MSLTARIGLTAAVFVALLGSSLAFGQQDSLDTPLGDPAANTMDFTGLGPAPLNNPRALFEWSRRAKDEAGCTLAESGWIRLFTDHPSSEWAPPSLYSVAVCMESNDAYEDALILYQRLLDEYPEDPLVKDAMFRKGLVLEEMGEYRKALRLYRKMSRKTELRLSRSDKAAVSIQRDIELLLVGRERRGVNGLMAHLERYETLDRESQEPWRYWIGKTHIVLGQLLSNHALSVPTYLTPMGKLKAKLPWNDEATLLKAQLDSRGRDLLSAQSKYQDAIGMEIPEWSLAAIYYMGRDHEALYRDLVGAPTPDGLNSDESEAYQHEVMDRSYPILVKAYRYYYHGNELARSFATDTKWEGLLEERTRALDLEGITVDELDLPPRGMSP